MSPPEEQVCGLKALSRTRGGKLRRRGILSSLVPATEWGRERARGERPPSGVHCWPLEFLHLVAPARDWRRDGRPSPPWGVRPPGKGTRLAGAATPRDQRCWDQGPPRRRRCSPTKAACREVWERAEVRYGVDLVVNYQAGLRLNRSQTLPPSLPPPPRCLLSSPDTSI